MIRTSNNGPASARNTGAKNAKSKWLLFSDSDCLPTKDWLKEYCNAPSDFIAYAGNIKSRSKDLISKYYQDQKILIPFFFKKQNKEYPHYVVTANCLIAKEYFDKVGGFSTEFLEAAGEDVEISHRLWKIGSITYIENSIVLHDFNDGIIGFIKRFFRYEEIN